MHWSARSVDQQAAQVTGPIAVTSPGDREPFDVTNHLSNDRLRAKLGLT